VSLCSLFFFNLSRTLRTFRFTGSTAYDHEYGLCGELGNRLGLPAGLGDLPLYAEEDGWYSVLGPWKGTTDKPDDVNEYNPEANLDILPAPVNPPKNARLDPTLIFCEYRKCSGNRLTPPLSPLLYSH